MKITMAEENRINVIQAVSRGQIVKKEASRILRVEIRQINRLLVKLRESGIRSLIHGNRGKISPRKTRGADLKKAVELARTKYQDVNDTHLSELLEKHEGILIGRETLRSELRKAGIAPKKKKRRPQYRRRRERKASFGVMIQVDASRHDWLEGRGPWMTLVGGKDDATGYVWAHFVPSETTWAYMGLVEQIALSHGLPLSLYSDRHSIFTVLREPTIIEQLKNQVALTQFGRAMEELGIGLIKAWSAPAKGRIENVWGVFQDRLVVELRLAGARTMEEANELLGPFIRDYNHRFTVPAREKEDVFRKRPDLYQLNRVLCLKETRTVNKDHTISFEGLILQIPPSKKFRSLSRKRIEVLQLKDGTVEIEYENQCVARFSPEAVQRLMKANNKENNVLKSVA